MRILYVERPDKFRDNLSAVWRVYGYDVVVADTIAEALQQTIANHFDRIVCGGDVERSGDGADMAKQLADAGKNVVIFAHDPKRLGRPGVRFADKGLPASAEERMRELFR